MYKYYNTTTLKSADGIDIHYPLLSLASKSEFFRGAFMYANKGEALNLPFTANEIYCLLIYLDTRHADNFKDNTFMWFDHEPTQEEILTFVITVCKLADFFCIDTETHVTPSLDYVISNQYGIDHNMIQKFSMMVDGYGWDAQGESYKLLLDYYKQNDPQCLSFITREIKRYADSRVINGGRDMQNKILHLM